MANSTVIKTNPATPTGFFLPHLTSFVATETCGAGDLFSPTGAAVALLSMAMYGSSPF
jgi:hypothetical protein